MNEHEKNAVVDALRFAAIHFQIEHEATSRRLSRATSRDTISANSTRLGHLNKARSKIATALAVMGDKWT